MTAENFVAHLHAQGVDRSIVGKVALQAVADSVFADQSLTDASRVDLMKEAARDYAEYTGAGTPPAYSALADVIAKARSRKTVAETKAQAGGAAAPRGELNDEGELEKMMTIRKGAAPETMTVTDSTTLAQVMEAFPHLTQAQAQDWLDHNRPDATALGDEVTKSVAYGIMKRRAEQERQDGDSPQQAMARFMKTADGRRLYEVYKALPDDPEPAPIAKAAPLSRAQQEVIEKADEIKKAFPGITDHQARAEVYKRTPGLFKRVQHEVYYGDGPEAA